MMRCSLYEKSKTEKVVTLWGQNKDIETEIRIVKKNGRWIWECRACGASDCDHVRQARAWLRERKKQQEELWRRMDALYPAEPARTHVKFAPCLD